MLVYVGLAVGSLHPADSCAPGEAAERHKHLWGVLKDKQVQNLSLYVYFCTSHV